MPFFAVLFESRLLSVGVHIGCDWEVLALLPERTIILQDHPAPATRQYKPYKMHCQACGHSLGIIMNKEGEKLRNN